MKAYFKIKMVAALAAVAFASCAITKKIAEASNSPSRVELKAVNGKFNFYVNGRLFEVKGAGGTYNLTLLKSCGGNSFRTWGANNGKELLETARRNGFMVAMGLGMRQQLHNFDYNDTTAVKNQFERIKNDVDSLKNHPNLLCWVAGNELNLAGRGKTLNPKVYDALKEVVDYIHKTDPNHPVTTTFAGVNKNHIKVALERCPDLDFISLQVYAGLLNIEEQAKKAEISKPYMVTEYGPRGHWEGPSTAWGREIEETSTEKANGLAERIRKGFIENKSGLCLGGYAFVWGQKQERTPTWYGLFLKTGESTAMVDELTRYWSGNYPENRAPHIDRFELDAKKAIDNIYLEPGKTYTAKVYASDPDKDALTYQWEIRSEVKVRSQGGAREIEPDKAKVEIQSSNNGELTFVAPDTTGDYRIFSYVYDGKNKAGTANIPFYVK
jgi:hypothetical protein